VIGGTTNSLAANTLSFSGSGAAVVHSGTGDAYINAPITLTSNTTFEVQNASANLYILGDYGATASTFTKTGAGTLWWGTTNTTTVTLAGGTTSVSIPGRGITMSTTGPVNVNEGTLALGNTGGSFLSNSSLVTIASGATFDFGNNDEDFGSVQGAGTLVLNGADINTGLDNRSVTWSGRIIAR